MRASCARSITLAAQRCRPSGNRAENRGHNFALHRHRFGQIGFDVHDASPGEIHAARRKAGGEFKHLGRAFFLQNTGYGMKTRFEQYRRVIARGCAPTTGCRTNWRRGSRRTSSISLAHGMSVCSPRANAGTSAVTETRRKS